MCGGRGSLACAPCPQHLLCNQLNTTLVKIELVERFWRPGYETTIARPCRYASTCVGGLVSNARYNRFDDSACAPGRGLGGAYCLLCTEPTTHYFDEYAHRCIPCETTLGGAITVLVLVPALILLAIAAYTNLRGPRLTSLVRRLELHATRLTFRPKLRIAVSFVQVVTQLERVYAVRYPPEFNSLLSLLDFVNIDLLGWAPSLRLRCLFGITSFSFKLFATALAPFALVLAAPLVVSLRGRPLTSALPFILGLTYLLFPAISSFGFRVLAPCDCFQYIDESTECFLHEGERCSSTADRALCICGSLRRCTQGSVHL